MNDYEPQPVNESTSCEFCGELFVSDKEGEKYCSISCGYRDSMCVELECPECGDIHYTEDECNPYCSDSCLTKARQEAYREDNCLECGVIFYPKDQFDQFCTNNCEVGYNDRLQAD